MKYIIGIILFTCLIGCSVCRDYETDVILLGQAIIDDYKVELLKSDRTETEKEIMIDTCDQYMKLLRKE